MKDVFKLVFFQLVVIYTILVFAVGAEILWVYAIQFNVFALIIGIFGIFVLSEKKVKIKYAYLFFTVALLFSVFLRTIPYWDNSVPLGYDVGIYKYIFERFSNALPNIPEQELDNWVRIGFPSGLPVLMDLFYVFGFTTHTLLTWVFILFSSLLMFPLYFVAKEYFGKEVGVISALLYAFSFTQLQTFAFMYYKNVMAMGMMLFAVYFMKKKNLALITLFAISVGFIHRPTFLMLVFVWFVYMIVNKKEIFFHLKAIGITAVLLSIIYAPRFNEIILAPLEGVFGSIITPGVIGSGTFFSFFKYQFVSLTYLPFAIVGFTYLLLRDRSSPILFWFIINSVIVIFKLMFFNRFIIHLDIVFILAASIGIVHTLGKTRLSVGIICVLFASSGLMAYNFISDSKPLLNNIQLESIIKISNVTEEDAYVMATTSYYSPWILGYSGRKTIAPGLFDYDKWDYNEWLTFWSGKSIKSLMKRYEKPLYVFIGKHPTTKFNFSSTCFEEVLSDAGGILYKYVC